MRKKGTVTGFRMFLTHVNLAGFPCAWLRAAGLAGLLLFAAGCSIPSDKASEPKKAPPPVVKPDDVGHLFSRDGREKMELVDNHLLGKAYLPGGNLAEYKRRGREYRQFLARASTPEKAMFLMMDFKDDLKDAKFVPHLGGYFGLDGETPVLILQRGHSLAGVVGLPEQEADQVLREFAPRLD